MLAERDKWMRGRCVPTAKVTPIPRMWRGELGDARGAPVEMPPRSGLTTTRFLGFIGQKVNRAPNWNWRAVLTVVVTCPKEAATPGCVVTDVMSGTLGIPNCARLATL